MTNEPDGRSPDEMRRMIEAMQRVEDVLKPMKAGGVTIFTPDQAQAITALLGALDHDGIDIISQIVRRERQALVVRSWFEQRRKRFAAISGYVLAILTFVYAIRDVISDVWHGITG